MFGFVTLLHYNISITLLTSTAMHESVAYVGGLGAYKYSSSLA